MHKFFAKTEYLAKSVIFLPQCHSTNDEALKMVREGSAQEGLTIITANQSKGRGQRGNSWESMPGLNATFSLVIKPKTIKATDQFILHTITTLAIYDTLYPHLGSHVKIKWPNDIYYKDKKVGGVLIENTINGSWVENSVIGIGLNINQESFNSLQATSLLEITLQTFDINTIIEQVIINFEAKYDEFNSGALLSLKKQYHGRLYLLNEDRLFEADGDKFNGRITGIDESGKLLIQHGEEVRSFNFKEVRYL